jgi:hypothetical protein
MKVMRYNEDMKTNELKNKKITLATFKSFIKKSPKLYVEHKSSFDGMTDCVQRVDRPIKEVSKEKAIGMDGVYLVGGSRDRFNYMENDKFVGIEAYNCCGSAILWAPKN